MHKDDLLELHKEMLSIKEQFEQFDDVDETLFDPYDQLEVGPHRQADGGTRGRRGIEAVGRPYSCQSVPTLDRSV